MEGIDTLFFNIRLDNLKLSHLKYGLLISATTFLGAGKVHLYAQDSAGKPQKIESKIFYKKRFMQSVAPQKPTISVDFMVDSIRNITSNGNLLPDVNVIQLYADLDDDEEDEYLDSIHNKLVAAHEMWHRICLMNGALEKPMSASQFRNGQDNFEITACIVALLTFRDVYLTATPAQKEKLHQITDPKVQMYLLAADNGIIKPFSKNKNDFDFEMKFIAQTVSSFWNNTMSSSYADYHNMLTESSGRTEMSSPEYDKNFNRDIKQMNTIGGIDFSKYYDFTDVHNRKTFPKGQELDTKILSRSLDEPDYEAWINEKSQLKRFSRQKIDLPNFVAPRLTNERNARVSSEMVASYKILPQATGYKSYPKMNMIFFSAINLKKGNEIFKLYPCGALDKISPADDKGNAAVTTFYFDGSFEKGTLLKGRKNGTFIYYDKHKKEVSRCLFMNGKAIEGTVIFPFNSTIHFYPYQEGKLQDIKTKQLYGKTVSYRFSDSMPLASLLSQSFAFHDALMPVEKQPVITHNIKEDDIKKNNERPSKLIKFRPVYRKVNDSPKQIRQKNSKIASKKEPAGDINDVQTLKFQPVSRLEARKNMTKGNIMVQQAPDNIEISPISNKKQSKIKKVCSRVANNTKNVVKKKIMMVRGFMWQKR